MNVSRIIIMIRKPILYFAFVALMAFPSCQSGNFEYFKQAFKLSKQNRLSIRVSHDSVAFVLKDNKLLFEADVNGEKDTVQLDLGYNAPMGKLVSSTERPDLQHNEATVTTLEKSTKLHMALDTVNYAFGNFTAHAYCNFIQVDSIIPYCDAEPGFDYPLVGSFGLLKSYHYLGFNFTDNVMVMDQVFEKDIDLTGYQEVKCKFKMMGVLFITLNVNGKEHNCIFDTGNSGGIVLKDKKRVDENRETDVPFDGAYAIAASGPTEKTVFCYAPNENVTMDSYSCEADVLYVPDIDMDNVGMKFISRFDWIISPSLDKVYFRPRNVKEEPFEIHPYKITTANGRISILRRCLSMNPEFNVGDIIKSVNGEEITEENICHYYELLKEAKDWSAFDIQVK